MVAPGIRGLILANTSKHLPVLNMLLPAISSSFSRFQLCSLNRKTSHKSLQMYVQNGQNYHLLALSYFFPPHLSGTWGNPCLKIKFLTFPSGNTSLSHPFVFHLLPKSFPQTWFSSIAFPILHPNGIRRRRTQRNRTQKMHHTKTVGHCIFKGQFN